MELTKHVEDFHQNSVTHGCRICGQAFETDFELQEHGWSDHDQYICQVCNESFGKDQFKDHFVKEHFMPEIINTDDIEECSELSNTIALNALAENSENKLMGKEQAHESHLNIDCKQCNIFFKSQKSLELHLKKVHKR